MASEAWIRIRIRLRTALRAARLFKEEANRVHEERHHEKDADKKTVLSALANEHDESAREFDSELKRVDEGRDI